MFTGPCSALVATAAPPAISLNDGYTLISPRRGSFKLSLNAAEEWLCFFVVPWRRFPPHAMSLSGAETDIERRK
jgi:hypothetical protein